MTHIRKPSTRQFLRSIKTRQRMRAAHLGRKLSKEHRAAISAGMKKVVRDGR